MLLSLNERWDPLFLFQNFHKINNHSHCRFYYRGMTLVEALLINRPFRKLYLPSPWRNAIFNNIHSFSILFTHSADSSAYGQVILFCFPSWGVLLRDLHSEFRIPIVFEFLVLDMLPCLLEMLYKYVFC